MTLAHRCACAAASLLAAVALLIQDRPTAEIFRWVGLHRSPLRTVSLDGVTERPYGGSDKRLVGNLAASALPRARAPGRV